MGATPKDPDEKVRRGYVERDSIVWADGREKLVGRDWKRRVKELEERCGGICEHRLNTGAEFPDEEPRCSDGAADPHHIIKRSLLRDDRLSNLLALCEHHHRMMHPELQVRSDRAAHRQPLSGNELEAT